METLPSTFCDDHLGAHRVELMPQVFSLQRDTNLGIRHGRSLYRNTRCKAIRWRACSTEVSLPPKRRWLQNFGTAANVVFVCAQGFLVHGLVEGASASVASRTEMLWRSIARGIGVDRNRVHLCSTWRCNFHAFRRSWWLTWVIPAGGFHFLHLV